MHSQRQITDIITPDLAARVKQLMLFSRFRVQGRQTGENKSVLKGSSTDFLQHRQYFPGDNIKYLDWRVFGRTGRYVIREYEELTNLDLYLVVDNSASMGFGAVGDEPSKHQFAVEVAAMLSYLMLTQKDSFSLSLFGDSLAAHVESGGSRRHLLRLYETLLSHKPAGTANWIDSVRHVQARITRKGLVIVLSDFMDDPELIGRGLSGFRSLGCDVIAFHLLHPLEQELTQDHMTRYVDLEDASTETVDPLLLREAYARQYRAHADEVRQHCTKRGISYSQLIVGQDFEKALGDYLQKRMARLL
jgi:uncharacterized protein (DUF58 family)